MTIHDVSGRCLCGAVTIHVAALGDKLGACHCKMCRKWSGGPFIAADSEGAVTFSSPKDVTRYPSSEWAERGFCRNCGTHLFYYYKENDAYYLPVGIFDLDKELTLSSQIFVDEKPHYYEFANKTQMKTGAEFVAQFEQTESGTNGKPVS